MATITAETVKKLRDMTDRPMMECKAALTEAEGDLQKAVKILREKNSKIMAGKAERETAEGRIGIAIHPATQTAAIIEVRCESAPVAKSDAFMKLVDDLAEHLTLTATAPSSVEELLQQPLQQKPSMTINERVAEVVGIIRENMKVARFKILQGGHFGKYVHFDGSVGVVLQVEGETADDELLKDICMHITAKQPIAVHRDAIDPKVIENEKEIARAQIAADPKNQGKPANIVEKIMEGKIKTWLQENVLIDQPFVKDDTKTVDQLLKAAKLTPKTFIRFRVGELSPN